MALSHKWAAIFITELNSKVETASPRRPGGTDTLYFEVGNKNCRLLMEQCYTTPHRLAVFVCMVYDYDITRVFFPFFRDVKPDNILLDEKGK